MTHLPLYLISGFSQAARKRKLRETAVRTATTDAEKGLNTRIPFIKSLIGKAVFDGPSYNMKRFPAPLVEPGLSIPCGRWMSKAERRKAVRDAVQFNIENADKGIQAVPGRGGYLVAAANVNYIGDLKFTLLKNPGVLGAETDGAYEPFMHQIFVKPSATQVVLESTLLHEVEHAQHFSLFHLAGYPMPWLSIRKAEYLSMLRTLFEGNFGILFISECTDALSAPHANASRAFFHALKSRHGFSEGELRRARVSIDATIINKILSEESESFMQRLVLAAREEYYDTYKRIFGLDFEDIFGVVESLPYI